MSVALRPFAFSDFRACPAGALPPTLESELRHVEETEAAAELAAAFERGRAEGEAAALESMRADRDTALLSALDALHAAVEELVAGREQLERDAARTAADLALAAGDMLAGRALAERPGAAIEEAIGRLLAEQRRGTPIEVRVHPSLLEALEKFMEQRQQFDRRRLRVTIVPDESLAAGDARLVWDRGSAELDAGARRAALCAAIEEFVGS